MSWKWETERDGGRAAGREGERKRCRRIYGLFYLKILKRGGNSSKGRTHCICLALEGVSEFCHTITNPASSHPGCVRLMAGNRAMGNQEQNSPINLSRQALLKHSSLERPWCMNWSVWNLPATRKIHESF